MVLQIEHETFGGEIEGRRPAALLLPFVVLPLIEKTPPQRRQQLLRSPSIVGVVSLAVSGERDQRRVVEVVVPERVEAIAFFVRWSAGPPHESGLLGLVLRDEVGPSPPGGRADPTTDRRQDVIVGGVEHLLGGVEAEAVEVKLLDPVAGVLDEELARGGGVVPVEVDGVAPFVLVAVGEVTGRKTAQVVFVGSDVVVDHVQDHADADGVRGGHETAEIVRPTVKAVRRPEIDAIVTPAEPTRGVRQRHELDERDAQLAE